MQKNKRLYIPNEDSTYFPSRWQRFLFGELGCITSFVEFEEKKEEMINERNKKIIYDWCVNLQKVDVCYTTLLNSANVSVQPNNYPTKALYVQKKLSDYPVINRNACIEY